MDWVLWFYPWARHSPSPQSWRLWPQMANTPIINHQIYTNWAPTPTNQYGYIAMETDYWQKPIGYFVVAMEGTWCDWMKALMLNWRVISLAWHSEGWPSHHSSLTFLWFELISVIRLHSPLPLVGQVDKLIKEFKQIEGEELLASCFVVLSDKPSGLRNDPTQNCPEFKGLFADSWLKKKYCLFFCQFTRHDGKRVE